MPKSVFLGGCQIKVDLDKKSLPEIECRYDRERVANPKLQEGMVCKNQFSSFEKGRKLYLRFEVLCRPAERVFRKLHYVPSEELTKELKQLFQQQKKSKSSLPSGEMIFKVRPSPKPSLPSVTPRVLKPSGLITA